MTKSPMFGHALDSFQHGIEHYMEASPRSRKFALLHFDQAVELLIKERIVDAGKSIYKSDGKTLSFHEAFGAVERVISVPELPRLEELHDLRNVVQHKGVTPDQTTTSFYVSTTYDFVRRFLKDEFGLSVHEFLTPPQVATFEAPERRPLPERLLNALQSAMSNDDTTSQVLAMYTALELAAEDLAANESSETKISVKGTLRNAATAYGMDAKRFHKEYKYIDILRGQIMHSSHVPLPKEVEGYFNTVRRVLSSAGFDLPQLDWQPSNNQAL